MAEDGAAVDSTAVNGTFQTPIRVGGTAESHDTHIITIDSAELDTCNKCNSTEKLYHLVS